MNNKHNDGMDCPARIFVTVRGGLCKNSGTTMSTLKPLTIDDLFISLTKMSIVVNQSGSWLKKSQWQKNIQNGLKN